MNNGNDICQGKTIHTEKVQKVKQQLTNDLTLREMAETFKTLGDKTRVTILQALIHEELCVCDIAAVIGMSMSLVSHQLRILRTNHLVKYRREGKTVYYSLDDDHVVHLLKMAYEHVTE